MERGSTTDACKAHLEAETMVDVRQTRRGYCQEIMGCEARTEFNYLNKEGTKIAHSIEDTNCFCRLFCGCVLLRCVDD